MTSCMWIGLPFGLRSAPKIFSVIADALQYLIGEEGMFWLRHYLDDFVLMGPPNSDKCEKDLKMALKVTDEVGFPVADDKTDGPATFWGWSWIR